MSRRSLFAISVAAHAVLVGLVVFYGGLDAKHGVVRLDMSPERMVRAYGPGDAGQYMHAALALVRTGHIASDVGPAGWWVLDLWPPGMVWLDALAVRFSPVPVGVTVALALSVVWGVALALLTWPFVRRARAGWLLGVVVADLLVLGTWPFQSWMFANGIMYADGFAAAFLLIGLALVVHRGINGGPMRLWLRDGLLAGTAVAGSVYFRASNNLIPVAFGGLAAVLALVLLVRRLRHRPLDRNLAASTLLTATAAVTTILLVLPYGALIFHREHRLQFVNTQDLLYAVSWQYAKAAPLDEWLLDSGDPLGCVLDAEQCQEFIAQDPKPTTDEMRDALISAIVHHPGQWFTQRVRTIWHQWFTYYPNPAEGYAYLALLLAALGTSLALAWRGRWVLLMVPLAALALLGPFSFVHVEERYLIPVKLLGLLTPTLALAWAEGRRRAHRP